MDTILLEKVKGSRIDCNSMFEEDLSSSASLDSFYGTPKTAQTRRGGETKIPDYLDQGIDITTSPLYQYLNKGSNSV